MFNWFRAKEWHGDVVHMKNSCADIVRNVYLSDDGEPYVVYFGEHYVWLNKNHGWDVTYVQRGRT